MVLPSSKIFKVLAPAQYVSACVSSLHVKLVGEVDLDVEICKLLTYLVLLGGPASRLAVAVFSLKASKLLLL